jgi:hypothetical protein
MFGIYNYYMKDRADVIRTKSNSTGSMRSVCQNTKRAVRKNLIALLILLSLCPVVTWLSPVAVQAGAAGLISVPLRPQLTATAIVPGQVGFCQNFGIHITVINYGNALARNVHIFYRQFPGDFFTLVNVDQMSSFLNSDTVDIALEDLKANEQTDVNFTIYAPFQGKLSADWTRKFLFNFSTSFDGSPETLIGNVTLLAGNGKIIVYKSGFAQQ